MIKRFKTVSFVLFAMALSVAAAHAETSPIETIEIVQQNGAATGTVVDANGDALTGASVVVKGTTKGAMVDNDGKFSVAGVKAGDVLRVSFIGYKTAEVKWEGRALNIVLEEDNNTLDEVVVTALGMKREKKALGYAVTDLKGEELNANLVNPVSALQGKVAGVEISAGDGGMFGSSKILIRGASTLGKNNQPIYVVDGVILDNGIKEGDADWSRDDMDWGNELKNLNPDDFESVSVLKGAAATALYGSRGLNGAVVITTKSGKGKKGLGINFSQTFGFDVVTGGPSFQNEFGEGYMAGYANYKPSGNMSHTNEFYTNAAGEHSIAWGGGVAWGPKFDGSMIEYLDLTKVPYSPYKNNFVDAYDTGFNTNTNVAIQGANDNGSFYTSLSYKHADGNTPNYSFDRLSFLGKASYKITQAVEIETGISFANSNPKSGGAQNFGELFIDGTWNRMYDSRFGREHYKSTTHGGLATNSYGDEYGRYNDKTDGGTWWSIYETSTARKETSVRPSLKLTAQICPWLKFVAEGNFNYYYVRTEGKSLGAGYANDGGGYSMSLYTKEQSNLNANLYFDKQFGEDWHINAFLRGEYYRNFEQTMSMNTNDGLIVPGQYFIANSKGTPGYSGKIQGEKNIYSIAAQVTASWRDQIYLDVTGRNDWSSSLVYADGHGNFSYFYPSISATWLISTTFRDKLPEWISFWKIRGSWAQVGNDTNSYLINSAYSINRVSTPAGNTVAMDIPNTIYDANLKPERKNSYEAGLDFRVLHNRIGLDFTFYRENTTDQIMQIAVPSVSGVSNQYINAGNIQNQGFELALNTTPIQTKDWQWDLNFTWTKNTSKIVELHENVAEYIRLTGDPAYGNYRIGSVARVGGEFGTLMSDACPNYDEKTGLPILETASYGGRHAVYYTRSGELREVGKLQPDFLGSVNTSLTWKNLSLRASIDMRFGGKVAIYGSHYGTAYGYTKSSLFARDAAHGGLTYKSIWDGETYDDGVIPNAIMPGGYDMPLPDGTTYKVAEGGETYASLVERGLADPQHASSWTYWNNSWGRAAVGDGISDDWFADLNYVALREISLSYRFPSAWASKIAAKNLSLTFTGHNLCYLYNSLPNNFNPESIRGTQASQFMIRSVSPYVANFTFTISASF